MYYIITKSKTVLLPLKSVLKIKITLGVPKCILKIVSIVLRQRFQEKAQGQIPGNSQGQGKIQNGPKPPFPILLLTNLLKSRLVEN